MKAGISPTAASQTGAACLCFDKGERWASGGLSADPVGGELPGSSSIEKTSPDRVLHGPANQWLLNFKGSPASARGTQSNIDRGVFQGDGGHVVRQ